MSNSSMVATQPKSPLLWNFVKGAVLLLAILAVGAAAAGAVYQVVGTRNDARRFPQRGKSVSAGQLKLNIDCSGLGSPAVILDSGMGVPAVGWTKVQPDVAKFARVCSYDRAGYGWSD